MSRLHIFAALLLLTFATATFAQSAYDAVDPIIGTSGDGNTFPGASLPFGMVQWSPDTGDNGWYFYNQKKIYGFGMTHLSGAGCPLYGDAPILPITATTPSRSLTESKSLSPSPPAPASPASASRKASPRACSSILAAVPTV